MKKVWKFKLANNYVVNLARYLGPIDDCIFIDYVGDQIEIVGFIVDGELTIVKGYEWDGCTPKITLFGQILGTPDFKETYEASLVHDFLIEYCIQHTFTRKQIDTVFQKILESKRFKFSFIYAGGVHLFRPIAVNFGVCKNRK